ncbi:MAG: chemotaxis protein CheB [Bacteroidales bacterium]|nr:chemotaxis protein CheB [Bacteroidales bacterium]
MANKYVVIGGSAGSFQTVLKLLEELPKNYPYPVFLVLHRLKNVRSGFIEALSIKSKLKLIEPADKDPIEAGKVYLAPANYHMYIQFDNTFSLSTEETINHSRPAIDITFSSLAFSYTNKVVGVLLSGANKDGSLGLKDISTNGGITVVQDPNEAQIQTMPQAALDIIDVDKILSAEEIINFVTKLHLRYD